MADKKTGGKRPRRASDKPARATRTREKAPGPVEQPLRPSGQRLPEQREAQQVAFLAAFRELGTILHAAAAAKVSRGTVYDWIKANPEFSAQFDQARDDFVDSLEAAATLRARDGVQEPVFGQVQTIAEAENGKVRTVTVTEQIGTKTVYSDKLMEVLLRGNRREKYNVKQVEVTGKDGAPLAIDPTKMSDEQLLQLAALLRALNGSDQK